VSDRDRINRLELAAGAVAPDVCPGCGADWCGSTVAVVEADGRRRWACCVCLTDRRPPANRKARPWAYPVELLRAL
jgi:hypothetical protein